MMVVLRGVLSECPDDHADAPLQAASSMAQLAEKTLDNKSYHTYCYHMARGLEAEIKQGKPFKSIREEALLNLVRTAAELEHQGTQFLKPFGLTLTQYNVLRILRGSGADGLCRNAVGARLVRQVPDVTRLLDRMEESGLITRERGDVDRRYVTTRLTAEGLDLVTRLDEEITTLHERQFGHLSARELRSLVELLEHVRNP